MEPGEQVRKGRLLIANLQDEGGQVVTFINIYAPSGPHVIRERRQFNRILMAELYAQGKRPIVIGGDWNAATGTIPELVRLEGWGWRRPVLLNNRGEPGNETFRQGSHASELDGFVLSPELATQGLTQQTDFYPGVAHAVLTLNLDLDFRQGGKGIPVRRPPKIRRVRKEDCTSVDWQGLRETLTGISRDDFSNDQAWMDAMWEVYLLHVRMYLEETCVIDGPGKMAEIGQTPRNGRSLGAMKGRGFARRSREEIESTRILHRLHSLARGDGDGGAFCDKILEHAGAACRVFRVSKRELKAAILTPKDCLAEWGARLQRYRNREAVKGYRRWKKESTWKGKPTAGFYRWLRGATPDPPLAVCYQGKWHRGPKEFFGAMEKYWSTVMCSRPTECDDLSTWLEGLKIPGRMVSDSEVEALYGAAREMKVKAASGLDMWPVRVLRCLPKNAFLPLGICTIGWSRRRYGRACVMKLGLNSSLRGTKGMKI